MIHFVTLIVHCAVCCVLAVVSIFHGFHPDLIKCIAYSLLAIVVLVEIISHRRNNGLRENKDDQQPEE
jgi:hypothetical protein